MPRITDEKFDYPDELRYCIIHDGSFEGLAMKVYEKDATGERATDDLVCIECGQDGGNVLTTRQIMQYKLVDLWKHNGGWIPAHARRDLAKILGLPEDRFGGEPFHLTVA